LWLNPVKVRGPSSGVEWVSAWLQWFDRHAGGVQAVAGFVQAAAAVITLMLTLVLIRFTSRSTASARRQAEGAADQVAVSREQVREAVRAREAALQPFVHADATRFWRVDPRDDTFPVRSSIDVYLRNVGAGPALSLRGRLDHQALTLEMVARVFPATVGGPGWSRDDSGPGPLLLEPGQEAGLQFAVTRGVVDGTLGPEAQLRLEYRDLIGRWWATTTPVKLTLVDLDGRPTIETMVADQEERVGPIEHPEIPAEEPSALF
jgi:hypothetical protein